MINEQQNMSL